MNISFDEAKVKDAVVKVYKGVKELLVFTVLVFGAMAAPVFYMAQKADLLVNIVILNRMGIPFGG